MDWCWRLFSNTTVQKRIHSSALSILYGQFAHPYTTTGKTIALTRWTFISKLKSLLFNILSRFVTAFLPRSKHLLIPWLQSPSAVILEPPKIKSVTVSIISPSICHELMGLMPWSSFFECWVSSQFFTLLFHFHQQTLQFFFTFCHKDSVICVSEVIDISPGNHDFSLCFIQPDISHDVLCIEVK